MVSHVSLNKTRRILRFVSVVWGAVAAEMKKFDKGLGKVGFRPDFLTGGLSLL